MDWSLEQPDTRVIGLFLEAVREPAAFVAALDKAARKGIPVVVLKIGKSPLGASMAVTHTGALAGNHAAFEALFRRYGVIEVNDFDEMASILMLLQSDREAADGDFAAVFESGGFRELITDEAFEVGVDFATLQEATVEALKEHLDPGLEAENPLDAWGSHHRFEERFEACLDFTCRKRFTAWSSGSAKKPASRLRSRPVTRTSPMPGYAGVHTQREFRSSTARARRCSRSATCSNITDLKETARGPSKGCNWTRQRFPAGGRKSDRWQRQCWMKPGRWRCYRISH
jgi:hypothetical protein